MTDSNAYAPTGQIDTIKKTIKHAYWHLKFVGWILILALFVQFALKYLDHPTELDQQIDRFVIIVGFFILLVGSIFREVSRIRKEKYANIQSEMHAIHHTLRDIMTCLTVSETKNANLEQLKQLHKSVERELMFTLDKISSIFSMLTGTTCRACLKQIFEDDDNLFVYTLVRDSESSKARKRFDKERSENHEDPIEGNEDFSLLFDEDQRWFFSNNLPRRATYFSSSDSAIQTGDKDHNICWWHFFVPSIGWTLPYRSTIVWPVQQREADAFLFDPLGCIAFLAIDSQFKGVFKERFDAPLGAGIADAFFHPLILFADLTTAIENLSSTPAEGPQSK